MTMFSDRHYSMTQSQLESVLENTLQRVFVAKFNDELKNVKANVKANVKVDQDDKLPSFTESQCRKMKLPQLKYEVHIRKLMVVGTGTGGASKKIDYINALLGRQMPRTIVRSI